MSAQGRRAKRRREEFQRQSGRLYLREITDLQYEKWEIERRANEEWWSRCMKRMLEVCGITIVEDEK